ncbi:unnamed protein product [Acanthoscelides obtectus]|uniref:Uncharacterized protein n=1 Tax=Acanthoscelides obtectus TaxID=200917 RepID=A0A9P0PDA8_ACAOB|nr:unnamed protein product [Acanthoscelides obtectus]CAK1667576.1 hypothetical protein AOBTE_LOCUS25923 [Acanthoscelides obtectus]
MYVDNSRHHPRRSLWYIVPPPSLLASANPPTSTTPSQLLWPGSPRPWQQRRRDLGRRHHGKRFLPVTFTVRR